MPLAFGETNDYNKSERYTQRKSALRVSHVEKMKRRMGGAMYANEATSHLWARLVESTDENQREEASSLSAWASTSTRQQEIRKKERKNTLITRLP